MNAREDGDEGLQDLANKLALHMRNASAQKPPAQPLVARAAHNLRASATATPEGDGAERSIGGLR